MTTSAQVAGSPEVVEEQLVDRGHPRAVGVAEPGKLVDLAAGGDQANLPCVAPTAGTSELNGSSWQNFGGNPAGIVAGIGEGAPPSRAGGARS
jgi:hypothetical protein